MNDSPQRDGRLPRMRDLSSDEAAARKAAMREYLRERAEDVHVEVGQVWRYAGPISLLSTLDDLRRYDLGRRVSSIRITQVPDGRRTTIRYVKISPLPGGNGRPDRGERPITEIQLARAWELTPPASEDAGRS